MLAKTNSVELVVRISCVNAEKPQALIDGVLCFDRTKHS
jgi:hypothetical protein